MTNTGARWKDDTLYVLNGSIVGTAGDAMNGRWYAHGCMDDWEDVRLGDFQTQAEARKAVEDWVAERVEP